MGSVEQDNAMLIGAEAAHEVRRAQIWRLAIIAVGVLAVAATVAAQRTGNPFAVIIGVLAWGGVIASAIGGQLSIRRAKTLASAHLAATLGFPVRRACFSTPAGWRAFIERESRYHAQGYRPKFSISVGRKPGSPH